MANECKLHVWGRQTPEAKQKNRWYKNFFKNSFH